MRRGPPGWLAGAAWGLGLSILLAGCSGEEQPARFDKPGIREVSQPPPHQWTEFVPVDGQPEPVPAQWVATPEGRYAHGLKIPHPVAADSGYRQGMKPEEYFLHLCRTEAGVRQYRFPKDVRGILFLRPPASPTDYDLLDRRKLEAPVFEAVYQGFKGGLQERGRIFVSNAKTPYFAFYEESADNQKDEALRSRGGFIQASNPGKADLTLHDLKFSRFPESRYALTWRGVRRPNDREFGIGGVEIILLDRSDNSVIAVYREYGLTGRTPGTAQGAWWLNAALCPHQSEEKSTPRFVFRYIDFVLSGLSPPPLRSVGARL